VELADKWAAFSLHAVLLLTCSGCGARSDLVGPGGSSSGLGSSSSGGSLGSSSGGAASSSGGSGSGSSSSGSMGACGPASCTGCCSTSGQCLVGTVASACGTGGNACATFPTGTCSEGVCKTGTVVLFGGGSVGGALNDTWTFDGTSRTQVSVSSRTTLGRSTARPGPRCPSRMPHPCATPL
jgi:hypothetical protein